MSTATKTDKADQQEFKDFKTSGVKSAIVDAMAAAVSPVVHKTPLAVVPTTPTIADEMKAAHAEVMAEQLKHVDADLVYILSQPRGHNGESEKAFCNWIITKVNKLGYKPVIMDEGAIFVDVVRNKGDKPSRTMFSCHVDTVHPSTDKGTQALAYDASFNHVCLDTIPATAVADPNWKNSTWQNGGWVPKAAKSGHCLGADDGAGIWIMLKMIEAAVPGGYVFHRGEERGGVSSQAIAKNQKKWLASWDHAIAFDRPKDFEVITHQGGVECCSQEFGKALAEALTSTHGDQELKYETSNRGLFTDTRHYRYDVPECTNIGVGYYNHHGEDEYIDYGHLVALKNQCLVVDWAALPVKRDHKKAAAPVSAPYHSSYPSSGHGTSAGWQGHASSPKPPAAPAPSASGAGKKLKSVPSAQAAGGTKSTLETMYNAAKSVEDIMDWIEMDPELTAKCVMQALIEGRSAQIQIEMILAKTLKAD